jgi:phosphoribosylformylglycinamidine synthase (EC 6.3.5.3)
MINPVESREASLDEFETLDIKYDIPTTVETVDGFIYSTEDELKEMLQELGLAMDLDDIKFCQKYFKEQEKRNPTITEIRMIDTYWSDHCRHTTFSTMIDNVSIEPDYIAATFTDYINARKDLYAGRTDKPITLMDLACFGAKQLKKAGSSRIWTRAKRSMLALLRSKSMLTALTKTGCLCSRTKHTTILQRSSLSVVQLLVLAVLSETRCQDVHMYIRLCV